MEKQTLQERAKAYVDDLDFEKNDKYDQERLSIDFLNAIKLELNNRNYHFSYEYPQPNATWIRYSIV